MATSAFATTVTLMWNDTPEHKEFFLIERSLGDDKNFVSVATVSSRRKAWKDTETEVGVKHFYRVWPICATAPSTGPSTVGWVLIYDGMRGDVAMNLKLK